MTKTRTNTMSAKRRYERYERFDTEQAAIDRKLDYCTFCGTMH